MTGGGYARVASAPGDANWSATAGGNGTTSNAVAVTFPAPTANWGSVTHWGIFDADSAGNLLIYAAPSFAPGALTFQIDN